MLNHRDPDKARYYLDALDDARCNGRWQDILELTRKVGKHAPQRQCLILTAQTERRIVELSASRSATSSSSSTAFSPSISSLVTAAEKEKTFPEDAFQAQVCLAWLHSTIGEPDSALSRLPSALNQASQRLTQQGGITARWTHVCIVIGAYIRGTSLDAAGNVREAARFYESMLPYIASLPDTIANTPEHRYWTECFLARYCMLSSGHVAATAEKPNELLSSFSMPPKFILTPFRAYADHFRQNTTMGTASNTAGRSTSHAQAWKAYYDTLTVLVQRQIVQPVFKSQSQQNAELTRVQAIYESILLRETKFPKANEANPKIENWVDQVMANWRAICRSTWQEEDLGEGGPAAFGRAVLDILYRAATRSFHSTRVLRHLFTVHTALAEFSLATKALDSYLQILTKGKARVEKSGEAELGLDDDATALETAAAGISMLCKYGRREDAERAMGISRIVEQWLQKLHSDSSPKSVVSAEDVPKDLLDQARTNEHLVPRKALALGYYALGVSQSSWARVTYESSSRSDLQAQAISKFRIALEHDLGDNQSIEKIYSLAFVLAETRDLDAAIATVKRALSSESGEMGTEGVSRADFAADSIEDEQTVNPAKRRFLLRCWHLLALLLSARQNFFTAIASCEAALDLYGGRTNLYREGKQSNTLRGLEMSERKNIIEIKMTQLSLTEIIDGPEEAVNASGELLGLYTKLFKYSEEEASQALEQEKRVSRPSSSNGTMRSFRGSILGLPKDHGPKHRRTALTSDSTASSSLPSESPDETTRAPMISAIPNDTSTSQNSHYHSHFLGRHESNKLRKRNSRKSMGSTRRSRAPSPSRPSTADGSHHHHLSLGLTMRHRHNNATTAKGPGEGLQLNGSTYASDEVGVAISHDLPSIPSTPAVTSNQPDPLQNITSTTQNMNHKNPNTKPVAPKPPPTHNFRSPPVTLITSMSLPEPQFPLHEQSRHALTLLTKIWLVISSLYRRASMPVDAQGAVSEATTHAQNIETAIARRDGSSAEAFSNPGYGGIKSSGEVWADVLAEQAGLHVVLGSVELASAAYEKALGHYPNHLAATVGLSNILLDSYAKSPISEPDPVTEPPISTPTLGPLPLAPEPDTSLDAAAPDLLSRLAARDRAYGLLSALTKSGTGWDCSEAWYALARAYELGGQIEKAKEALWWVVDLEESRGVRLWNCIV